MTNTAAIFIPTGEPEIVPARVRDSPMAPGEPEKRLMLAVLERAVDEFRTYGMVPTGRGRRLCRDVAGWFGFLGYRRVRFRRHLVRRPDSIPPSLERVCGTGTTRNVRTRFEDRGPAGQCRGAVASLAPCGRASRSPARVTAAAIMGPRSSAHSRPPLGFRIDRGWAHAHRLADGTDVTVRMLRPEDREAFLAGFERLSPRRVASKSSSGAPRLGQHSATACWRRS